MDSSGGFHQSHPLLYNKDDSNDGTIYCCCIRRRVKLPIGYGSQHRAPEEYPLHEYPMVLDPVAYRFHAVMKEKRMSNSALKFVQRSGHVSLQDTETDDVTHNSPLILFCFNSGNADLDASRALNEARDGPDVFLIVVRSVGPNSPYNNTLYLSAKNRRRIGACGVLSFSAESKKFQETDDNMDMLRRLRHFLLDVFVEMD